MVVYCIDESQANICVVVGHEHNVKELVALRVQLPQSGVYSLQGLQEITKTNTNTKKKQKSINSNISRISRIQRKHLKHEMEQFKDSGVNK